VTEANIKTFLEENKKDTKRPSGTVKDRNLNTPDDEDDDDDEFDDFKEEVEETKEFIANEAEKLAMSMDISHFVNDIKLQFRLDTFEVQLFVLRRPIMVHSEPKPNWHLIVRGLCTYTGVEPDRTKQVDTINPTSLVRNRITLREISIYDYHRPDDVVKPAFGFAQSQVEKVDSHMQNMGKHLFNKTAQNMHYNPPYDHNGRPTSAKGEVDQFRFSEKQGARKDQAPLGYP